MSYGFSCSLCNAFIPAGGQNKATLYIRLKHSFIFFIGSKSKISRFNCHLCVTSHSTSRSHLACQRSLKAVWRVGTLRIHERHRTTGNPLSASITCHPPSALQPLQPQVPVAYPCVISTLCTGPLCPSTARITSLLTLQWLNLIFPRGQKHQRGPLSEP